MRRSWKSIKKILGIIMVVVGVGLIIWGYRITGSIG